MRKTWRVTENAFATWRGPHYFVATVGLVMIAVAVLYYAILTRPQPIPPPPLHITNVRLDLGTRDYNGEPTERIPEVCSGWTYGISWRFTVDRPVVVSIHRTVLDQYGHTIPGSEDMPLYRVYPWVRTIVERSRFTVPYLAPGGYTRAYAFVALDQPSSPEIFTVPFVVAKNCLEKPQDRTVSPNDPGRPSVAATATNMFENVTPTPGTEERRNQ